MSDINPNVAVTETAPVEANGGDAVTFDELDVLTSKKPTKEPKEKEVKEEKPKDLTSDENKGKKDVKPEKKDGEEEKPKAKEKGKEEKPELEDAGDDQEDSKPIKVKVNGKEESVTLKDLKANYSGKVAWDKKFTELDKQNKEIRANNEKLEKSAARIRETFQEPDPQIRMFKLAELAGADPVEFFKKMTEDNIKHLEKWQSMSDDERRAEMLEYEKSYYKHQLETQNKATKAKQDQESLVAQIAELRATHELSEDEFSKAYNDVKTAVKAGKIKPEELTPEFVVEIAQKERLFDSISNSMKTLKHDFSEQQLSEKIFHLTQDAFLNGLKPSDMAELVDQVYGVKRARQVVKEKTEARNEFLTGKKPVSSFKEPKESPLFFDDL